MSNEDVLLTADNCRYCLMCRHVCPVGHVTALETLTPHGWGLLIASQRRGLLDWNEDSVSKLYSCADCGACRAHCVTDQPLPHAIAVARAQVVEQGLAPPIIYEVQQMLETWETPFVQTSPERVRGRGEVALFVGDEARHLWPETLDAALTLLDAVGIEPVLIGAGRNNGYIPSSLGLPATARKLALANLADLESSGARHLLTLTPGDFFTFSKLYPERLGVSLPDTITLTEVIPLLAQRLIAEEIGFRPMPPGPPYAYVDPAHSVRIAPRYDTPRQLLSAIMPESAVELFWRRERTHPAGNTSLQFGNPQFADHLTWARLGDARQVGAQRIITEDPGTLHALSKHAPRFGLQIEGLYELLAAQLN